MPRWVATPPELTILLHVLSLCFVLFCFFYIPYLLRFILLPPVSSFALCDLFFRSRSNGKTLCCISGLLSVSVQLLWRIKRRRFSFGSGNTNCGRGVKHVSHDYYDFICLVCWGSVIWIRGDRRSRTFNYACDLAWGTEVSSCLSGILELNKICEELLNGSILAQAYVKYLIWSLMIGRV